jgi:hypothetical protein
MDWDDISKVLDMILKAVDVIGPSHAQNVPAKPKKLGSDVLCKGDARVAFRS